MPTKNARHGYILSILRDEAVRSQSDLLERLERAGIAVTQATLSRDLNELGVRKVRTEAGPRYVIEGEYDQVDVGTRSIDRLRKKVGELAVKADCAYAAAVFRTPPGAAQYLASFVDRANLDEIVGCTAGDDTVFVLAREPYSGKDILGLLLNDDHPAEDPD